jgi:hypothetical protein
LMTSGHLLHFAAILATGGGVYLVLGFVFRVEEILALSRRMKRRF